MKPQAIGIDFGTTNTAAAVLLENGAVKLLELTRPSAESPDVDPTLMKTLEYFPNRREAFYGQDAIDQYFTRDMEGRFLQSIKKLLPNTEFQGTSIFGAFASLEDLIARFLTETRKRIERELGSPIEGVPVFMGRPARYSLEPGREGLAVVRFKKACELSGFGQSKFVEEPVAAALTYSATLDRNERVLICDLGGGTSDFTLLEISGRQSRALATHGIPVAGDSLDSAFVAAKLNRFFGSEIKYQRPFSSNVLTMPTAFVSLFPKWHHHAFLKEKATWSFIQSLHKELVDPNDKVFLNNLITLVEDNLGYVLHQRVEGLKRDLSQAESAQFAFRSHPIKIEFDVTRPEFEQIIRPVSEKIRDAALETLRIARTQTQEVDAIYFTGGTSKVPLIRAMILEHFPHAKIAEKDTFTSVATGLALSAKVG